MFLGPKFVVARGKDPEGNDGTERTALNQGDIQHHNRLRDADTLRSAHQVLQTDTAMYYSARYIDLLVEHMHRKKLAEFVFCQRPISIWVLVSKSCESIISLVGHLGAQARLNRRASRAGRACRKPDRAAIRAPAIRVASGSVAGRSPRQNCGAGRVRPAGLTSQ
jgi:hypothetical protein